MEEFGLKIIIPTEEELEVFAGIIRREVWPELDQYMGKALVDICRERVGIEVK